MSALAYAAGVLTGAALMAANRWSVKKGRGNRTQPE